MSAMRKLTVTELKLFMREPVLVFFALAFPPLLLIVLGSVPSFRRPIPDIGGARVVDLYAPVVIALAMAMLGMSGLPTTLATYRERSILRRMSVTPVRPIRLLGAQLLAYLAMAVVVVVVVLVVGKLAFGVPLPTQPVGYLVAFLLSVGTALTIGLFMGAVAPSGATAAAIGSIAFFPVMFFAGLWFPREVMPDVLRRISDFSPLGAGVQSLRDAAGGAWPQLLHIAVMVGWMVAAGAAAARYFRWE